MVTKTKSQDRISKKLGRVIELPGDLVVVSRRKLTRVLEDLDDLAVAAERRKETPIPWEDAKKSLELRERKEMK